MVSILEWWNTFSGSDLKAVTSQARELLRARLNARVPLPVKALVDQCGFEPGLKGPATMLLTMLGRAFGVDAGAFRSDDRMFNLLCVTREELSPVAAEVLAKYSSKKAIDVFGYDVLHVLETQSDPELWIERWASLPNSPKGEGEWIDAILEMTFAEFLRFAAAMLPPDRERV